MRIVQAVAAAGSLTTSRLAEALPDVPVATLYRHVKALERADLLVVVATRRARGATERTFSLPASGNVLGPDDLASAADEDHGRWFLMYVLGLHAELERHVAAHPGDVDYVRDGIGYHTHPLWLDDDDVTAMGEAIRGALAPFLAHGPGDGRRLRSFSTVLLPSSARLDEES
jgi:hypothetical protein